MKIVLDNLNKVRLVNKIANEPMCVLFYADWCPHCVEMKPAWNEAANKLKNLFNMIAVRHDFISHLVNKNNYVINGYPKIFISNKGREVVEFSGERNVSNIMNFVKQNIKPVKKRKLSKKKSSRKSRKSKKSKKK